MPGRFCLEKKKKFLGSLRSPPAPRHFDSEYCLGACTRHLWPEGECNKGLQASVLSHPKGGQEAVVGPSGGAGRPSWPWHLGQPDLVLGTEVTRSISPICVGLKPRVSQNQLMCWGFIPPGHGPDIDGAEPQREESLDTHSTKGTSSWKPSAKPC